MTLEGVIDTHVHAGPDVRPRKSTAWELARAAREAGMRAIVLKNHHCSTVPLAAALTEALPGIRVFGGLVLNHAVGGFNVEAVDAALRMGAAEIWMPTLSAENECAWRGRPGDGPAGPGRMTAGPARSLSPSFAASPAPAPCSAPGTSRSGKPPPWSRSPARRACAAFWSRTPRSTSSPWIRRCNARSADRGSIFERCFCRAGFRRDWAGTCRRHPPRRRRVDRAGHRPRPAGQPAPGRRTGNHRRAAGRTRHPGRNLFGA
jgi:hypothetical protein